MSEQLARLKLELVNGVGDGPFLEAIKHADFESESVQDGRLPHLLILAATDEDAEALRAKPLWIKLAAERSGCTAEVVTKAAP